MAGFAQMMIVTPGYTITEEIIGCGPSFVLLSYRQIGSPTEAWYFREQCAR